MATLFKQVLIFANEKVRSVKTPTVENIEELMVIGGKVNLTDVSRATGNNSSEFFCIRNNIVFIYVILCSGIDEELKMIVRTVSGAVFVWYDTLKQYIRYVQKSILNIDNVYLKHCLYNFYSCEIPMPGNSISTHLTLSGNSLIFINNGRVYIGELALNDVSQAKSKKRGDYQMLRSDGKVEKKELHVKPKRVPLLNAVETVVVDETGQSFVALQQSAKRFLDIPEEVETALSFKSLLVEAQEDDSFCDLVFHVSTQS